MPPPVTARVSGGTLIAFLLLRHEIHSDIRYIYITYPDS